MCGIAGIVARDGRSSFADQVLGLSRGLAHRGPDAENLHEDRAHGVVLAQRRLAVIDLDPRSACPISNEDGTVWVTFNGEIYDFAETRKDLLARGHAFRSDGDAEVIVHLWEETGPACVDKLRGMFAFALWDSRSQTLMLARDRLGKKPLHWALLPDRLAFASEIGPLSRLPGMPRDLDLAAIDEYLGLQYVPAPRTAFAAIRKLPAASRAIWRGGTMTVERYWDPEYEPKLAIDDAEAPAELLRRLDESVRLRMIADVPLGAFLSGGLDSSAVVASMARQSSRPVKTYSIGFDEPDHDELRHARRVAEAFGCDHHEAVLRPDALALLPKVVRHHGEPFADPSAFPSFMVSEFARREVTVALTGDGGDELFAGYERYKADRLARLWRQVPKLVRSGIAVPLLRAVPQGEDRRGVLRKLRRFVLSSEAPGSGRSAASSGYRQWLQAFSDAQKAELLTDAASRGIAAAQGGDVLAELFATARARDPLDVVLSVDLRSYLPDDLMVKMDIASMACSLEARSPLLDHVLVEWAARLPTRFKLRGMTSKWLLRKAHEGILPKEILRRRKMGFGVPIERWLRRDLRQLSRDVLLSPRARERDLVRPEVVARLLDEHQSGAADHSSRLWTLLMLESWLRIVVDGEAIA